MSKIFNLEISFLGQTLVLRTNCVSVAEAISWVYGDHCKPVQNVKFANFQVFRQTQDYQQYDYFEPEALPQWRQRNSLSKEAVLTEIRERVQFRLIEHQSDYLMIHGASATKDQHCFLFPAGSGAGKTTLSAWILGQGFTLKSDELIAIDADERVHGFSQALNVKAPSIPIIERFSWLDPCVSKSIKVAGGGYLLPFGTTMQNDWDQLTAVVVPSYQSDRSPLVERLTPGQTLAILVESLLNSRMLANRGLEDIGKLSEAYPAYKFHYGSIGGLARCLEELL
jgi:hypothetical protein